jgi:predicted XRE-type DNA-binding protein
MKEKLTRSSGNAFLDLGFPPEEAEHLKVRSDLMIHLNKTPTGSKNSGGCHPNDFF